MPPHTTVPPLRVAAPGEGEDLAALMARDLGDDMGGGAEAVDADPLGFASDAQGAVADQPGAQQWRRRDIAERWVDREAIALVGDRQFGIPAVDLVAGKAGAVAQILAAAAAVIADAAGPAEPGDADPVADREAVGIGAPLHHHADDLMTRHQRQFRLRQLTVEDVQIGAAHRAGLDHDQQLPRTGPRRQQIGRDQRLARGGQQLGAHGVVPPRYRLSCDSPSPQPSPRQRGEWPEATPRARIAAGSGSSLACGART